MPSYSYSTKSCVICDCGTLVSCNKYSQHLKTKLDEKRMSDSHNQIQCYCGLVYGKALSSQQRHLHSDRHFRMMNPCIKKIRPDDIPPTNDCRFKKGYADCD